MNSVVFANNSPVVETAGLDLKGYCSSYLPMNEGHFVNYSGSLDESLKKVLQSGVIVDANEMVSDFHKTPTGYRFTNLVENIGLIRPQDKVHLDKYFESMYKPDTPDWFGYCNQWAKAAANRHVVNLVNKSESLVCNGQVISHGELKELATGLYKVGKGLPLYGHRLDRYDVQKKEWLDYSVEEKAIMNISGKDDFHPMLLELVLFESLKNGIGVVMDLDSSIEVWNHPIYFAEKTTTELDFDSVFEDIIMKLPLRFLRQIKIPRFNMYLLENHIMNMNAHKALQKIGGKEELEKFESDTLPSYIDLMAKSVFTQKYLLQVIERSQGKNQN